MSAGPTPLASSPDTSGADAVVRTRPVDVSTTVADPAPPPPPPLLRSPDAPPWRAPVTLGAVAVAGTAVVVAVDPTSTHVPLCPLAFATGLDCPLCGSLRSVHALASGDVGSALDHNLLVTAALPLAVAAWTLWLVRSLGRPVLPRLRWPQGTGVAVAVIATIFFVARNLPALAWLGSGSS